MPLMLKVARLWDAAEGIRAFEVVAASGGLLPPFEAGAHIDIEIPMTDGTRDLRSYSLAGDPAERERYLLGVLLDENSRGGSRHMHQRVMASSVLVASEPKNHFPLHPDAVRHVLIAGGIGVTPMLAMARHLARTDAPFEVHYAARTAQRMAFAAEMAQLCGKGLRTYFDGGDAARGIDIAALLSRPDPHTHVYVCGPRGLIDATRRLAATYGWPEDNLHSESFTAPLAPAGERPFVVRLARSGLSVEVSPNQSILDAVLEAGVDADFDCRRGECGACTVDVLSGEPDHQDFYLNARERSAGKKICICVSRAKSGELELDL